MPSFGASKLPDANVWLALAFSDHAHHSKAVAWFNQQGDGTCGFCRITQMALLRPLTNTTVMGKFVQSQKGAWVTFDKYVADPRVTFFSEPANLPAEFRSLSQSDSPSHEQWTDSYLAAFAKAGGRAIVTFDRGFSRFACSLELLR